MPNIYYSSVDKANSFVYPEMQGLATITHLGDIENKRFYHVDNDVLLPTSDTDEFVLTELSAEQAAALRLQNPSKAGYLPEPVPDRVSAAQALIALDLAGLYDQVHDYINDTGTPRAHRIAFDKATEFYISSPNLQAIATACGLLDRLPELFILAGKVEV